MEQRVVVTAPEGELGDGIAGRQLVPRLVALEDRNPDLRLGAFDVLIGDAALFGGRCSRWDSRLSSSGFLELEHGAGVDLELDAGDVAGLVGRQEADGVRDVRGFDVGRGHRLHGGEGQEGVVPARVLQVGPELPEHRRAHEHVGVDVRGVNDVGADGLRRQLTGKLHGSPSAMRRSTVSSNSLRSRSLSRKRPWRFFEKVE